MLRGVKILNNAQVTRGVVTPTCATPTPTQLSLVSPNAGSIDFFHEVMYPYHPLRFPVANDYGLHAVRSKLNEYPRTPGAQVCRGHFASNFSILLKFKAEERLRFTLLDISEEGSENFTVEIDMIQNRINLKFSNCRILQLSIPLATQYQLQTGVWHRIGIAVDLSFIAVYLDCTVVYKQPYVSGCTVVCDETIEVGVLESTSANVILL